ncbi:hypothetical protein TcasGA2_TC008183 [Tribolium castaneum]|uniref:Uncharacterized protein n=1 Tax=Tribolium castaneum TaxID=7070 RepID=D2A092_TRICA|nr:hypothetical protein TcasGA2_TC008183 [Tribolium castaneum]
MSLSFQSIFLIAPEAENYFGVFGKLFAILSEPNKTTSFHVYAFRAKNRRSVSLFLYQGSFIITARMSEKRIQKLAAGKTL